MTPEKQDFDLKRGDGRWIIPVPSLLYVWLVMASLLVIRVTVGIVLNYRDYLPPNFDSDFLQGRERYFWGEYSWPFYSHIASGPVTLILGLLLLNDRFRIRFPRWHRYLGRTQVSLVVLLVAPSGLWMAYYAERVASIGFGTLALATAACAITGWRTAVNRRFVEHRRWMWRCYLLLASAIVLRLTNGLATVIDIEGDWVYPMSSWTSWLVPLVVFELIEFAKRIYRSSSTPTKAS